MTMFPLVAAALTVELITETLFLLIANYVCVCWVMQHQDRNHVVA